MAAGGQGQVSGHLHDLCTAMVAVRLKGPTMQLVREIPARPVPATASDPTVVTAHPVVLTLTSRGALDGWIAGATGARLARAAAAGLRVPLGFVLTVDALRAGQDPTVRRDVRAAWIMTTASGVRDLVLRLSVVGHAHPDALVADVVVRDWDEFVDQVRWARVAVRARGFGAAQVALVVHRAPLPAQTGTVRTLPTSGLRNRYVTTLASGATVTMSIGGRVLDREGPAVRLDRSARKAIAHLGRDAAGIFGGRPRVDWVIERDGSLVVLDVHPPGEHPPSAYEMRHHLAARKAVA
jgi:hypothetical protein